MLARFFAHLKTRLETETGAETGTAGITSVVLGRPVHFVDGDPAADLAAQGVLEEIALSAGFREVAFQFEPIAAALQYEQSVAREELVLIVDIGGGTSDFSIVRVSPARADQARAGRVDRAADILANDGIRVGGTDLDRLLSLAEVMPHLGFLAPTGGGKGLMPRHYFLDMASWHRINMLYTARVASDLKALSQVADRPELIQRFIKVVATRQGHALAMAVEAAKIALSEAGSGAGAGAGASAGAVRIAMSELTGGPNPVVRRAGFEAAVEAPVARIRAALGAVLAQAGVGAQDIGTVFMTGGSSGLPVVRAVVAGVLPGVRIATGDMLGSVGTGLALEARARFR